MTNSISSLLLISIVMPNFKTHNIMSARVYFIKRVKDCKDVSICLRKMNSEDGKVYFVCILQFSCFIKTVCSQNINKQNVNIADETLTDCSFLSRYHYTNNYLKRRHRIRTEFPCLLGHPV